MRIGLGRWIVEERLGNLRRELGEGEEVRYVRVDRRRRCGGRSELGQTGSCAGKNASVQ